jgi:multiple sugar transport system substrate-binding protein
MENSYFEGKLYGLPMCLHPGGHAFLFYNKDMFEEAGLKLPDGDTYTVEDLREAANRLSTGSPESRDVYGYLPGFAGIQCHEAWIRTFGASSFVDPEGRKTLINTEPGLEWAKYAYALYNEDKVAPRTEAIPSGGTYAMFAAGKLAAFQSGTWAIKTSLSVVGDAFNEGVELFPIGPGGYGACGYLNSFAPTSASKHLYEAWLLTYAFCDERAGYLQLKLSGSLPGRPDTFEKADIKADPVAMVEYASMQKVAAQYFMYNFAAIEHQQALNAAMDKIYLGEAEPTQGYMDSVAEILQNILDKPR